MSTKRYLTSAGRNRPWTPGAVRALKDASFNKLKVRSLAKMLKRTEGALRQKARELRLPLGPKQRKRSRIGPRRKAA